MSTCPSIVLDRSDLSSYEKLRIQNIIRNNAKLRALGLISESEERTSNLMAQGIEESDEEDKNQVVDTTKKKRKRESTPLREGSRKSRRLQKLDVEIKPHGEKQSNVKEDIEKERLDRVKECREVRLRAAKAVAEAGAEKASKENPTASYEHCLMRVRTMTPKKLENRVSKHRSNYLILYPFFFLFGTATLYCIHSVKLIILFYSFPI